MLTFFLIFLNYIHQITIKLLHFVAGLLYLTFVLDIIHSLCGVGGDIFFTVAMLFVGKRGNSAKVFSVLSWSRYSKSPPSTKDGAEFSGHSEPCKPGAHCATVKKLYVAEKKLFKALKVS